MFGKLLKYEFKSQAKIMLTIIVGVIVLGIFMAAMFNINLRLQMGVMIPQSSSLEIFDIVTTLFAMICVIVLVSAAIASIIISAHRFYKNLYSNEGYLTFTLPVSTNAQLIAKLTSAIVWITLVFMALAVSVSIFFIFGTAWEEKMYNKDAISDFAGTLGKIFSSAYIRLTIELIILFLLSFLFMMITIYLAITIGSVICKKHKILAAAGIYIVINFITQILQSIIVIFGMNDYLSIWEGTSPMTRYHYERLFDTVNTVLIYECVLLAIMAVVSYIIMKKLIDKKLNLP